MIKAKIGCFCSCGQQQYYECGNMLHDFQCEYQTARKYARVALCESGVESLYVYVTGLSVALVAVINVCRELGVELTLMHFDRDTNRYYEQEVRQ